MGLSVGAGAASRPAPRATPASHRKGRATSWSLPGAPGPGGREGDCHSQRTGAVAAPGSQDAPDRPRPAALWSRRRRHWHPRGARRTYRSQGARRPASTRSSSPRLAGCLDSRRQPSRGHGRRSIPARHHPGQRPGARAPRAPPDRPPCWPLSPQAGYRAGPPRLLRQGQCAHRRRVSVAGRRRCAPRLWHATSLSAAPRDAAPAAPAPARG